MPLTAGYARATTASRQPCAAIIASSSPPRLPRSVESIFFTCQCGTNLAAPRSRPVTLSAAAAALIAWLSLLRINAWRLMVARR